MFEMTTAISRTRLRLGTLLRAGGVLCLLYVAYWTWMQYRTDVEFTEVLERPVPSAPPLPKKSEPLPRGHFIGKVQFAGSAAVILEGVDDHTLKLAVGHVPGTALPGQRGRVALAAHRDTFFRPLRNVKLGNQITLLTPNGKFHYKIWKTEIVKPDAMHVLSPTKTDMLTLITCYPFNFIGKAPLRYIVHAKPVVRDSPRAMHRATGYTSAPGPAARTKPRRTRVSYSPKAGLPVARPGSLPTAQRA